MSKLNRTLLSVMALGSLMSMELNGELERDRRRHQKPTEPKVVGYDHKVRSEHELLERRVKKYKFRQKRKRKGCRKGGRI